MTAAVQRQGVAAAGAAATTAEARPHGLRVHEPVVLHDLFSLRVHLRPAPVLALLRRAAELAELPACPTTVLHGDAHPGNILRSGGELLWIDLEDVAIGPPEWDTMHDEAAVLARLAPDPVRLAACLLVRDVQVSLCLASLDDVFGDIDGWADGLRGCVDGVRQRMP